MLAYWRFYVEYIYLIFRYISESCRWIGKMTFEKGKQYLHLLEQHKSE